MEYTDEHSNENESNDIIELYINPNYDNLYKRYITDTANKKFYIRIQTKSILSIKNNSNFYVTLYNGTQTNSYGGTFINILGSVSDISNYTDNITFSGMKIEVLPYFSNVTFNKMMELNFAGYETVVHEKDKYIQKLKEKIANYQTLKDNLPNETENYNDKKEEYNDAITVLKNKLEMYKKYGIDKITLYTLKNYDTRGYYDTFDPTTTNVIFMKTNGAFIPLNTTSDIVDDDVTPFTIKSILNETGKYVVTLFLQNNETLDIPSSTSDISIDTDSVRYITIHLPHKLTSLWLKNRNTIPEDLDSLSYAVSFYSDPDYKNLYDFFLVKPNSGVDHIPLYFKDENKEFKILSIKNPTDYYVTLYISIPEDNEFKKKYRYDRIYIHFESNVRDINNFIKNKKLLDPKFTGAILTRKSLIHDLTILNTLTPYNLTSNDMEKYEFKKEHNFKVDNIFDEKESILEAGKIGIYTLKNYDNRRNYITFDPKKVYAIVMTKDNNFKPIKDKTELNELKNETKSFRIGSIKNNSNFYSIYLLSSLDNNGIEVIDNISDTEMEIDHIKIIYVLRHDLNRWFNRDHILTNKDIARSLKKSPFTEPNLGTLTNGLIYKTLYQTEPELINTRGSKKTLTGKFIPENLDTMSNVVTFYSEPLYKNIYDYFIIPKNSDSSIEISFKDKEFKIMSIVYPTDYYVTLYKAISEDDELKKIYNYNKIYVHFESNIRNINDFIKNDKL